MTALVGASLVVSADIIDNAEPGSNGRAQLILIVSIPAATGLVSIAIIRSWLSVGVLPIAFYTVAYLTRKLTCPECSGPTYDVGPVGAIIIGVISSIPMVIGATIGTMLHRP